MNWTYLIGGAAVTLTLLGLLHQLLVNRKNATIETLTEKNKWLEKQLESAEKNSADILTERLDKRIARYQSELESLSKDYEANESLIKAKEEEVRQMKELMAEVVKEIANKAGEFRDFKSNYVCPYCESGLTTLKDIEEEDWTGSLREYDCGYSEIDGATHLMCPCDPEYPKFSQLQLQTHYSEYRKEWTCSYAEITLKTWGLPQTVVTGKSEKEAKYRMELMHEGKKERCPEPPLETPVF